MSEHHLRSLRSRPSPNATSTPRQRPRRTTAASNNNEESTPTSTSSTRQRSIPGTPSQNTRSRTSSRNQLSTRASNTPVGSRTLAHIHAQWAKQNAQNIDLENQDVPRGAGPRGSIQAHLQQQRQPHQHQHQQQSKFGPARAAPISSAPNSRRDRRPSENSRPLPFHKNFRSTISTILGTKKKTQGQNQTKALTRQSRRRRNILILAGFIIVAVLLLFITNPSFGGSGSNNDEGSEGSLSSKLHYEIQNRQIEFQGRTKDELGFDSIKSLFCDRFGSNVCDGMAQVPISYTGEDSYLVVHFDDRAKKSVFAESLSWLTETNSALVRAGVVAMWTRFDDLESRVCIDEFVIESADPLCGHVRPLSGCSSSAQVGENCKECIANHFGSTCQACRDCSSPRRCDDGFEADGSCSKCIIGRTGEDCFSCEEGYYGIGCSRCVVQCADGEQCNDGVAGDGSCVSEIK